MLSSKADQVIEYEAISKLTLIVTCLRFSYVTSAP